MKLSFPFQTVPSTDSRFQKIVSFSVRDINCSCICKDGELYTWGWDLGEIPTKLIMPIQSKETKDKKYCWEQISLGHTRILMTCGTQN
jgi:hypothetical protein